MRTDETPRIKPPGGEAKPRKTFETPDFAPMGSVEEITKAIVGLSVGDLPFKFIGDPPLVT